MELGENLLGNSDYRSVVASFHFGTLRVHRDIANILLPLNLRNYHSKKSLHSFKIKEYLQAFYLFPFISIITFLLPTLPVHFVNPF